MLSLSRWLSAPARRPHNHPELETAGERVRHYLGDLVYGANDGIITTFAVVAGVAGASLSSRTVIILGFANLLADGFSMGASNYLSIRSSESVLETEGRDAQEPYALRHAMATFLAFLVAGVVPLLAYLFPIHDSTFRVATALTMVALFVVGAARSFVTIRGWLVNGLEMLAVGAAAAAVAYYVGAFLAAVVG